MARQSRFRTRPPSKGNPPVFVRRSTHYRELTILNMELMVASRAQGILPSAEALEGLRRQLLFALPPDRRRRRLGGLRRELGGQGASNAYNRMTALFMAAYSGQPGIGEFEVFRKAVIEAAGDRRTLLDVLTELHAWLLRECDSAGVISQLETRLEQQGIQVVRKPSTDHRSDARFVCHGKGDVAAVASPAYIVYVEDREMVIRQGHLECMPNKGSDRAEVDQQEATAEHGESDGGNLEIMGQRDAPVGGQPGLAEPNSQHTEVGDAPADSGLAVEQGDNETSREVDESIDETGSVGKEQ